MKAEEGKAMLMGSLKMNHYKAVGLAEGFIEGTESEIIDAWQYLVNTGLAWTLQGWFGRTATTLINNGIINNKKENKK